MNATTYVWVVVIGVLLAGIWFQQRRRTSAVRALASRMGFQYLGSEMPKSLAFSKAPLDQITSVWNVIDGECEGIRVVAFDCRIGTGEGSWRRTVIAAQTDRNVFGTKTKGDLFRAILSDRALTVDRSGDWTFMYQARESELFRPSGLFKIDEFEAQLKAIA